MNAKTEQSMASHFLIQVLTHLFFLSIMNTEKGLKKFYQENWLAIHGVLLVVIFVAVQHANQNNPV